MNPTLSALAITLSTGFAQYSTPTQNIQCKELDFSSYHRAETTKSNLLQSNPERSHPNFAGKYLLLKNEYLFDTAWFVADCSTGKFIKEILSTDHKNPDGEFHPDSTLLAVSSTHPNNKTPLEFHVFQNEKWVKVEVNSSPTPTTTTTHDAIINTPKNTAMNCKPLDFDSNSRAQSAKNNLIENTPNRSQPNFFGHYLLLKGDSLFQTYWLIADCNTGKFFSEILAGNIEFNQNNPTVKIFSTGSFATFSTWLEEDQQWFMHQGKNTLWGKNAKTLYESIPNPDRSSVVRFEKFKSKISGIELLIKTGRCTKENTKYTCEVET